MDGGAWQAAVYGVAKSWTQLKRLSSSSSSTFLTKIRISITLYLIKKFVRLDYTDNSNISQRRQWYPTPVLLPGKSHGRRSLVGCSLWGREEWDTTERLHFPFSLSCIGEGNGNPLQYSCLENPRDRGAYWVAIYGVAQSRTRLKRLSSSSSSSSF